jgi:hypothetical protein
MRLDCGHISRRKIAPKDVAHVFRHSIEFVDEELPFSLEVSKLKDEVNRHRDRKHAVDQLPFRRAQIEVKAAGYYAALPSYGMRRGSGLWASRAAERFGVMNSVGLYAGRVSVAINRPRRATEGRTVSP